LLLAEKEEKDLFYNTVKQSKLSSFFHHVFFLRVLRKGNISLDAIWQCKASSWTSQWDATQTLKFIPMLHFPGTAP